MTTILTKLQIHSKRIKILCENLESNGKITFNQRDLLQHFYLTAEIYALVSKAFGEARGFKSFKATENSLEDLMTAYLCLDILVEEIDHLAHYTEIALASKKGDLI